MTTSLFQQLSVLRPERLPLGPTGRAGAKHSAGTDQCSAGPEPLLSAADGCLPTQCRHLPRIAATHARLHCGQPYAPSVAPRPMLALECLEYPCERAYSDIPLARAWEGSPTCWPKRNDPAELLQGACDDGLPSSQRKHAPRRSTLMRPPNVAVWHRCCKAPRHWRLPTAGRRRWIHS